MILRIASRQELTRFKRSLYREGWTIEFPAERITWGAFASNVSHTMMAGIQYGAHEDRCWIDRLYVHECYRNQGIGSTLVNHALSLFRRTNGTEVWVESFPEALAFYEALGFERTNDHAPTRLVYHLRPPLVSASVLSTLIDRTPDEVEALYVAGRIGDIELDAFRWVWRNSAARFSTLYASYEGQPAPSAEATLLLRLLHDRRTFQPDAALGKMALKRDFAQFLTDSIDTQEQKHDD